MTKPKKPMTQEELEELVKHNGIATANFWINGCMKGNPEQVGNQIEMLRYAACHALATYCFNKSKKECYSEPVSTTVSIMAVKDLIEDMVAEMEANPEQVIFKKV